MILIQCTSMLILQKNFFKERIAHGLLSGSFISTVLGMKLPGPNTIYLSQNFKFIAPVKIGDTIKVIVEVMEKRDDKKLITLKTQVRNQSEELVVDGEAVVMKKIKSTVRGPGMENSFEQWLKIKKKKPEDVLSCIHNGDDIILPIANGEPNVLMEVIEENATRFQNVRIHQMHAIKERSYIHGRLKPSLSYVSYFLSEASRKAFYKDSANLSQTTFMKFRVYCVNRRRLL